MLSSIDMSLYCDVFNEIAKEIYEKHGFEVFRNFYFKKISGYISYNSKIIEINERDDKLALFILCHEYGHLLIHLNNENDDEELVDFYGFLIYRRFAKNLTFFDWVRLTKLRCVYD